MAHWREAATQRYLPLFKLIPWALIGDSFYRIYRADFFFDVAVPVLAVFFGCAMISETRRELLWYSGVPMDYEREWATESGPRWIRTIGSRIRSGRTNRVVGASQDITAYKQTQHDLVEARDLSERALQARSQFLANMSHEIRTPMNGVIGMTSLLQATTLSDEQRDMVETVKVSGESLMSIINDILDFSKIDAGRIELEEQAFSLRECVTSALDLTTPTARDKNLNIGASITSDTPDRLLGDVTRLRQVLVNLLSNAVKFTERGSIQIDVQSLDEADKNPQSGSHAIEFKVSDTGVGIDPAARARLFQPFEQEDASITRRFGGTGHC